MGLLDRWTKRQEQKKLEQEKPPAVLKSEETGKEVEKAKSKDTPKSEKTVKAVVASTEKSAPKTKISMTADRILIRPLVTEKSAIAQSQNKYGFVVNRGATTDTIKRAIAEAYGVTPLKVNLINVSGKWVRFGRSFGRRGDFKKAIVTLPEGKSITIHEGV